MGYLVYSYVNSVAFSPDGQTLTSSSDKIIKIWRCD
ncbi:hypothetical protein [Nostoc sp. 106C]|nr:hypothetical protein [Nostoc sp. 106C]OUL18008.1 hypothetical protein BV375_34325 [Nostoc sp. 106C]OUL23347.1 hypothetical protein BV378_21615 [Nostoc sp. RF31YmG]